MSQLDVTFLAGALVALIFLVIFALCACALIFRLILLRNRRRRRVNSNLSAPTSPKSQNSLYQKKTTPTKTTIMAHTKASQQAHIDDSAVQAGILRRDLERGLEGLLVSRSAGTPLENPNKSPSEMINEQEEESATIVTKGFSDISMDVSALSGYTITEDRAPHNEHMATDLNATATVENLGYVLEEKVDRDLDMITAKKVVTIENEEVPSNGIKYMGTVVRKQVVTMANEHGSQSRRNSMPIESPSPGLESKRPSTEHLHRLRAGKENLDHRKQDEEQNRYTHNKVLVDDDLQDDENLRDFEKIESQTREDSVHRRQMAPMASVESETVMTLANNQVDKTPPNTVTVVVAEANHAAVITNTNATNCTD